MAARFKNNDTKSQDNANSKLSKKEDETQNS